MSAPSGPPPASIAILAGGQSRRMGTNKALLQLPPHGETMLGRQVSLLAPLSDDLMIIGPRLPAYLALAARVVPDAQPGTGPLGGLATALGAARHPACLIVACDLPLIVPALVTFLLSRPFGQAAAIVPAPEDANAGGRQPLLAVYHRRALPAIDAQLAAGAFRLRDLLDKLNVTNVPDHELRRIDPALDSFRNANDPVALAAILARLHAGTGA